MLFLCKCTLAHSWPGVCTKTLCIHRIIDAEGLDIESDSDSDGEEFAEDDLVTIARQAN